MLSEIINRHTATYRTRSRFPAWYDNELVAMLKGKERARSRWKQSRMPSDQASYKRLRSQSKSRISACYMKFMRELQMNIPNNIKLFWAYTKSKRKTNSYPSEFSFNNQKSSNTVDICQMFSTFFQSTYTNSETNLEMNTFSNYNLRPNDLSPIMINETNVENILSKVDVNKNGGPDGIPNIFLRHTSGQLSKPLSMLFIKSINSGEFPIKFKTSFITPIFKKGKKSEVNNYRPVCLLNGFAKVFERLVHEHVYPQVIGRIKDNQHGFVRKRSTLTNLATYTDYIANALDGGGEVHAIYTDFAKAFDSVDFAILLRKLNSFGIGDTMLS